MGGGNGARFEGQGVPGSRAEIRRARRGREDGSEGDVRWTRCGAGIVNDCRSRRDRRSQGRCGGTAGDVGGESGARPQDTSVLGRAAPVRCRGCGRQGGADAMRKYDEIAMLALDGASARIVIVNLPLGRQGELKLIPHHTRITAPNPTIHKRYARCVRIVTTASISTAEHGKLRNKEKCVHAYYAATYRLVERLGVTACEQLYSITTSRRRLRSE